MNRTCEDCGERYDDADCTTLCPHPLIMDAEDLAQKKLGLSLFGKRIRFNHQTDAEVLRVESCGWNGMVSIQGMSGEFAPHLFTVIRGGRNG